VALGRMLEVFVVLFEFFAHVVVGTASYLTWARESRVRREPLVL
jgi:hypothetical protein